MASYAGAVETLTLPAGVTSINARVWGAAGGGANSSYSVFQAGGAGGGFASGTVTVTPGQTLAFVVGQGGIPNSTSTTFGSGGAGGGSSNAERRGGSGGGYSGIFSSSVITQANVLLLAGGGGGASPGADGTSNGPGGGGGASGGEDARPNRSGRGGTSLAGGNAATASSQCSVAPAAGSALTGANGGSAGGNGANEGGGAGGGGYFGGGGGLCQSSGAQNGGGGGGSGFAHATLASGATLTPGDNFIWSNGACSGTANSGGANDILYTTGIGQGSCYGSGGNGQIVIQYRTPQITITKQALGNSGTFDFSGTNGFGTQSITVPSAGGSSSGSVKVFTAASLATAVTETIPAGWQLSSVTCSGLGTGGAYTPVLSTGVVVFDAAAMAASADIICTFQNSFGTASLSIVKTANTAGPVNVNDMIAYTFRVQNTGTVPLTGITVSDTTNAYGSAPVPSNEALANDVAPLGDSSNAIANDGIWTTLGPGDEITFTASYIVVQDDIDYNQ